MSRARFVGDRRARGVAAALALVAALTACTPIPTPTPTPTASPNPTALGDGTLTIGTLFPTSGGVSYLAPPMAAGVAAAVRDINAAGGVNGKPVAVIARDSGDASTQTAEASFADLVKNHADVVIGPASSVLAQRLLAPAEAAGIPMISPAAGYPQLDGQKMFLRTIPAYGHEGTALGELLPKKKVPKVVLVYTDEPLGRSMVAPLRASLAAHGGSLAAAIAVPLSGANAAAIATQAKAANPDAVVLATPDIGDLTKGLIGGLAGAGLGGGKLWLTSQNLADYSQALPGGLLNGVNGILEGADSDATLQAKFTRESPNLGDFHYAPEAYDATVLAALAASIAHDDAGAAVAAQLRNASVGGIKCGSYSECLDALTTEPDIDYDGISGTVNLDASGDPTTATYGTYVYGAGNQYARNGSFVG